MPYVTVFDDDGTGVTHTGNGIVTAAEVLAGAVRVQQTVRSGRKLTHGIVNFIDVVELQLEKEDMDRLVNEQLITASFISNAVVAIITPQDHAFGIARMWQALAEKNGWTSRVFRTQPEALAWLRHELAARHAS